MPRITCASLRFTPLTLNSQGLGIIAPTYSQPHCYSWQFQASAAVIRGEVGKNTVEKIKRSNPTRNGSPGHPASSIITILTELSLASPLEVFTASLMKTRHLGCDDLLIGNSLSTKKKLFGRIRCICHEFSQPILSAHTSLDKVTHISSNTSIKNYQ